MRGSSFLLLLLASWCRALEVEILSGDDPTSIVGGTTAGTHPYFVLGLDDTICGGSLIHDDVVLTAAHCDTAWTANAYIDPPGLWQGEIIPVAMAQPHPWYATDQTHDIMLVQLQTIPKTGAVIPMNKDPSLPKLSTTVLALGFGHINNHGESPTQLQELKMPVTVTASGTCYSKDQYVCAGGITGQDTCGGDSGGPLVQNGVVLGALSGGSTKCAIGKPSAFVRTSYYYEWIQEFICEHSAVIPQYCPNAPSSSPSRVPVEPTSSPTQASAEPTDSPTAMPITKTPTLAPVKTTDSPTARPTTKTPSLAPVQTTDSPSSQAPVEPTSAPVAKVTNSPSKAPVESTNAPVVKMTDSPSKAPVEPTSTPVVKVTNSPSKAPVESSDAPVVKMTDSPSQAPVESTDAPVVKTTDSPSKAPVESTNTLVVKMTDSPSQAPVESTDAPVVKTTDSPSTGPVEYTAAPVKATDVPSKAPIKSTSSPVKTTDLPSAAPVEPKDSPIKTTDAPSRAPQALRTSRPVAAESEGEEAACRRGVFGCGGGGK